MTPQVGQPAPDFALRDQHGALVRLGEFEGEQAVLLVFYPFAFSPICTSELTGLRDARAVFEERDVQVVGVSCDAVPAQRAWAEAQDLGFPLLSDFWPHGEVARAYGVLDSATGFATRGSFLVDVRGVLRWSMVNGPGEARPLAAHTGALAALPMA